MDEDRVRQVWNEEQLDRALHTLHVDVRTGECAARRARTQLMLAARADPRPPSRWRSAARWLSVAAAVGVLVAGALLVQTVQFGSNSAVTATAAVEVLFRSAERAAAASDPPVGPGQYRYVETHS